MDKYKVEYKGKMTYINSSMVKNDEQLERVKKKFHELFVIFDEMKNSNKNSYLVQLVIDLENCEFELQKEFGFKQSRDFHRHWYSNEACSCPKLDNDELLGTEHRLITEDCKLHGTNIQNYLIRQKKLENILKP
jgi:hypothetical protein